MRHRVSPPPTRRLPRRRWYRRVAHCGNAEYRHSSRAGGRITTATRDPTSGITPVVRMVAVHRQALDPNPAPRRRERERSSAATAQSRPSADSDFSMTPSPAVVSFARRIYQPVAPPVAESREGVCQEGRGDLAPGVASRLWDVWTHLRHPDVHGSPSHSGGVPPPRKSPRPGRDRPLSPDAASQLRASTRAATTWSCWARVISGNIGSERICVASRSAAGKSPRR